MNSFLLRRLAPFFVATVAIEFLTFGLLLLAEREYVDWAFMPMIKTVGVLLKTTSISFLYMMLPYVIYLLILPAKYVNSKFDHFIASANFSIFVFLNLFEETMSLVFWEKFSAAFNFIAIEYLIDMREIADDISQNYLFIAYIAALIIITFLIVRRTEKFLLTSAPYPHWFKRTIYTAIYLLCCALIYVNADEQELQIDENHVNNELSKDGTYSLVRSLWKSDLTYQDFIAKNKNILKSTN